jgi:hypothetical protein
LKKVIFYFGHPAQYLFARSAIKNMGKSVEVIILLKTKDVLEDLVKSDGFDYINILPEARGNSKFSIILSLLKRIIIMLPIVLRHKPYVMVSTDASVAIIGFILRRNVITITEDDYIIIKSLGDLTYPFTTSILCPVPCSVGKWEKKKVGYLGYMKLSYLHPKVFSLDPLVLEKYGFKGNYALIRVAKLTAHHDFGVTGIDIGLLEILIKKFEKNDFRVLISSEGSLPSKFDNYKLDILPHDMHHVLAGSSFLVCDSQSMAVEAAMLGVPSIRYSSFAGRISVLEELEKEYQLTFGILSGNKELLLDKLDSLIEIDDIKEEFKKRREKMLKDKICVSDFLEWFICKFPESSKIMKENPDYQLKFK